MALTVGIVRDDRFLDHMPGHDHPEHPSRLRAVYRLLDTEFQNKLKNIPAEPATLEILEQVHTPSYVKKVLKTSEHTFTNLAQDTPVSAKTYLAAWLSVGGCLEALKSLVFKQCDVCFALVRPPGHHALSDRAAGFCIFNNIGIIARTAINIYGLERVLIVDWDIHHGNGIQDLFDDENKVLYFSTHDRLLYPYTGDWDDIGKNKGKGYTVNIPVPRNLSDADFIYIYREILTPLFQKFKPELVLIAAGFDAHHDDPIGKMKITASAFGDLTKLILYLRMMENDIPVLMVLEGGYSIRGLTRCIRSILKVLTAEEYPHLPPVSPSPVGKELVKKARAIHSPLGVWTDPD